MEVGSSQDAGDHETAAPTVSVVIETITSRYDAVTVGSMPDDLTRTLQAIQRQTFPVDRTETIVVVDYTVDEAAAVAVVGRFPFVTLARSQAANYCAAKNAGAQAARGSIVALVDGDCEPDERWLEHLVAKFTPDVDVVAGRTTYETRIRRARLLSGTDFGHVTSAGSDEATGFNINNVAFRRSVLLQHPLDARVRRNGGCTLLYHQLRAAGRRMVYAPEARVSHGDGDIRGLHFVRKHFGRGFDSVDVYRLDLEDTLRASRLVRRFGAPVLVAITLRRIVYDWLLLVRRRRHLDVPVGAVPGVALIGTGLRLIELAGMIMNSIDPRHYVRAASRISEAARDAPIGHRPV